MHIYMAKINKIENNLYISSTHSYFPNKNINIEIKNTYVYKEIKSI